MPRKVMSLTSWSDSSRVVIVRPSPRAREALDNSNALSRVGGESFFHMKSPVLRLDALPNPAQLQNEFLNLSFSSDF